MEPPPLPLSSSNSLVSPDDLAIPLMLEEIPTPKEFKYVPHHYCVIITIIIVCVCLSLSLVFHLLILILSQRQYCIPVS